MAEPLSAQNPLLIDAALYMVYREYTKAKDTAGRLNASISTADLETWLKDALIMASKIFWHFVDGHLLCPAFIRSVASSIYDDRTEWNIYWLKEKAGGISIGFNIGTKRYITITVRTVKGSGKAKTPVDLYNGSVFTDAELAAVSQSNWKHTVGTSANQRARDWSTVPDLKDSPEDFETFAKFDSLAKISLNRLPLTQLAQSVFSSSVVVQACSAGGVRAQPDRLGKTPEAVKLAARKAEGSSKVGAYRLLFICLY